MSGLTSTSTCSQWKLPIGDRRERRPRVVRAAEKRERQDDDPEEERHGSRIEDGPERETERRVVMHASGMSVISMEPVHLQVDVHTAGVHHCRDRETRWPQR